MMEGGLWIVDGGCGWWMVDGEKCGGVKMGALLVAFIIITFNLMTSGPVEMTGKLLPRK